MIKVPYYIYLYIYMYLSLYKFFGLIDLFNCLSFPVSEFLLLCFIAFFYSFGLGVFFLFILFLSCFCFVLFLYFSCCWCLAHNFQSFFSYNISMYVYKLYVCTDFPTLQGFLWSILSSSCKHFLISVCFLFKP